MLIGKNNYPIIGKVKLAEAGRTVAVIDLPLISDEKWIELTNTLEQIKLREQLREVGVQYG